MNKAEENINALGDDNNSRLAQVKNYLAQNEDYTHRFVGHANTETDIKEAAFLGENYITAGSDCGNLFIWHRSGRLVFLAKGRYQM